MYKKIWGLKQLEKMRFLCPPYVVIDITEDAPADLNEYVLRKIKPWAAIAAQNSGAGLG